MSTTAAMTTWTPTRFAAAPRPSEPYFQELADAGRTAVAWGGCRIIGLEAEAAMLAATSGVNTHRGAIFGLGLLCAAAGARAGGLVDPDAAVGRRGVAPLGRAAYSMGRCCCTAMAALPAAAIARAARAWRPPTDFLASTKSACRL